ncbi:hemagglutinin [Synechococcus sp. PCC 6312]|uniref:hemagglutinin n=1 Tax=Synechococcus sp. (strain ATCC 27167 / PCC 6312) TaxID=195253 RepID=UPI00029F07E5|nr:hemagglutinin [Synechococcus sp. PCC 6312]AFY62037.1 Hemagglutinin [Synechococcus sp. PCC 6312]
MSEAITASEARQILDAIQALTVEMKVNQARTDEQFKTLRAEVKSDIAEVKAEIAEVRSEVKSLNDKMDLKFEAVQGEIKSLNNKVDDLRTQQRSIDNRLWSFIVALILLLTGGLVKLTLFDKP